MAHNDPRITARDLRVIEGARRRRKAVISATADGDWLSEIVADPPRTLRKMHARGALVRVGHGRYAIPFIGAPVPRAEIGWHGQLHARLDRHGPYYLGFGTALEEHRLTDRSEPLATVGIGFRNKPVERGDLRVADRTIVAAFVSPARQEDGIELVRLGRDERYRRSDLERTLLDCVDRPDLAGGFDSAILAWGRALDRRLIDAGRLRDHALALGGRVLRRTGALLDLVDPEAGSDLRMHAPRSTRRPDRPIGIDARFPAGDAPQDPYWHVAYNVPRSTIEAWLGYGK
jgi:predicted transcriptional regulator of viral defense system